MLESTVCRYEHLHQPWFKQWAGRIYETPAERFDVNSSNRKQWEFAAIAQALHERDMLRFGRRGLGFAVGQEPLSSLFASYGVQILGTDLHAERNNEQWTQTGQHSDSIEGLFRPELIARADFDARVSFQPADMRDLDGLPTESFDFLWSSCSLEHLGDLQTGLDFVERSTSLLKPGGVAVHTTEYNVSSNVETIDGGWSVVYRRSDIESMDYRLRKNRCGLVRVDFDAGISQRDLDYDIEPYFCNGKMHLKYLASGYIATSILLIVHKA